MFKWAQKRTNYWSKIRRKAPKVPDITCPDIDKVLNICEKAIDSKLTETKYKSRDFGSSLAKYNISSGPYIVLPILGPRSDAAGRRRKEISPNSTELSDIGNSHEMFAGPLGNILRIVPRVSNSVQQSTSLFTELGSAGTSLSFRGGDLGNHKFIDTLMSITGITTGYSIDVPIRIIKKD